MLISDGDYMRLAMPSGNQELRRDPELKRKAWLAVFLGSALFWVVVALLIWKVWG
ncbi:YmiA family putative membrane protein [Escherichia coli]|nr:YmiA family putative membrane protein [Escherichia coli]EJG9511921.1 YmiA family putative membrane protein [Shigella boydii]EFC8016341.1 YmiA family putative membrane protein [Escherichia coli]EGM7920890.1 YmiA family putative membrane protein [Escherichia coli]EHW5284492.1 YmiA family putative membrane protein [Escherichia coli]